MSEYIIKSLPLGILSYNDGEPLKGHVIQFDLEDDMKDIVVRGAFTEGLELLKKSARNVNLYWKHQINGLPCGEISVVKEDKIGLYLEGNRTGPAGLRRFGHDPPNGRWRRGIPGRGPPDQDGSALPGDGAEGCR